MPQCSETEIGASLIKRTLETAPLPERPQPTLFQKEGAGLPISDRDDGRPTEFASETIAVGIIILLTIAAAVYRTVRPAYRWPKLMPSFPVLQNRRERCRSCHGRSFCLLNFQSSPQLALLALASGYIFSGSFAFLCRRWLFRGAIRPGWSDRWTGPNTPAWIYVLLARYVSGQRSSPYALLQRHRLESASCRANRPTATIIITVACVLAVTAGLTWIVTAKTEYLPGPPLHHRMSGFQTRLGNQINVAALAMGCYRANGATIS